ncbi:hypothetical protein KXD40_002371 [Peronospora effusa]|uniref:Complex 1 LYR protein domain-containing protein n=1 Tax=Peronospora effusa TaxID=542832 RepID=A0A3M6VEX5_9STRA|nr:hypothetical protein DD238_002510 [Peronospora effusa]UIZ26635.1 hypothetical protein KXD40_002371 [Peronospora effusa]CAI5727031.1 unnamed protein product [Peronospora effusa]
MGLQRMYGDKIHILKICMNYLTHGISFGIAIFPRLHRFITISIHSMAARELRPLYKKLLRLAKGLPESKRQMSLDQVRREFRNHGDLTDSNEISALIQRAQSSVDFLKIVTPRTESDSGVQRFIYRNGQRVNAAEFEKKGEENARYKTQDIEGGLRRHHQLLRRQHFMDRKSGPPPSIF